MADIALTFNEISPFPELDCHLESGTAFDSICLHCNLRNVGTTQFVNYPFKSLCVFNDRILAAGPDGLFAIGGNKDNGGDIEAYAKLPTTDLGSSNQKRIRKMFVGYESDGNIDITVQVDERPGHDFRLSPTSSYQHGAELNGRRDQKGRYLSFTIKNIDGSDFSIDSIDALVNILGRKPSGS
jgi:hypothetical protein